MEMQSLHQRTVLRAAQADVGAFRERARHKRLLKLGAGLGILLALLAVASLGAHPHGLMHLTGAEARVLTVLILLGALGTFILLPMLAQGRSPHVVFRPHEIETSFDDVKGIPVVVEEVVKTLNLFLAHKTFRDRMGGTPRRGMLFEGPPGTGKTYLAKAIAKEAGVPFLFVSASAFQSMYYGQTNRKVRSFFKALRVAAQKEGGAIGFIEEIDAIAGSRAGMGGTGQREGVSGVVNELLIQLQSFEQPARSARLRGWGIDKVNRLLPPQRQLHGPKPQPANILVIGATNRAADLDPALLRPGRFDRTIAFDLPSRAGRREIIDYYLARKAHDAQMDEPAQRDTLAAMTFGYSPVMLEHIFDEALVWALRRGADGLGWEDVQHAKMTEEIGLAQPVEYSEAERRTIATHEAGHATVAWLVGKSRKLEVLSIVKRKEALGLLAHSEREERFTRTRSAMEELVRIAMGGMVAEELFFGETTSGVAGDLQAATTMAAEMVGTLGMDDSLFSFAAVQTPGTNLVAKVSANDAAKARIEAILTSARDDVREMLDRHRSVIEALRDALLERDELIGEEILETIRRVPQGLPVTPLLEIAAPSAMTR